VNATSEQGSDHRWVESVEELEVLARAFSQTPVHVIDTESNSGFVYNERLCLLQVNVGGELWVVDLLSLPGEQRALDCLREPLESSEVRTLLHGGEFDVGCFKRDYGISLGGVWDTQQAASFLGWERTGLGSVIEAVCGVALEKAYSHYNWGRRPIAREPLAYAVDDVRYLHEVAAHLEAEVKRADLTEELAIANETVMAATWRRPGSPDSIWRLKGVRKLPREAMPNLVALWEWRESVARLEDRPPGRVLHTELLLAMARRSISGARGVRSLGLRGRMMRYADEIETVLDRAHANPPQVPAPAKPVRPAPGEANRLKRLRDWRRSEAESRGVPCQVVLPPTAMQFLARNGAAELESVPQLGTKRARLYGSKLTELCG
jgi:ribonuclease D